MKTLIAATLMFSTIASAASNLPIEEFTGTYDLLPSSLSRNCQKVLVIEERCQGIVIQGSEKFCKINQGQQSTTRRGGGGHSFVPSLDRTKTEVELIENTITKTETTRSYSIGIYKMRDIVTLELNADVLTRNVYASLIDKDGDLTDDVELNQQCLYKKKS